MHVEDADNDFLAAVTGAGRLLIFPIADLPLLPGAKEEQQSSPWLAGIIVRGGEP